MSDFDSIMYKGKPLVRDGFTGTMAIVVMKKSNPDQLDMRYKCNKQFVKMMKDTSK